MKLLLTIVILSCVGCADVEPFARLSAAHQLNQHSDYLRSTERSYECSKNLQGIVELGVETKGHWEFSVEHQSWIFCGAPFNNDAETYTNKIKVSKKFGGQ